MNEREIFAAALEMANREDRTAFLREACGDNLALRRNIEELLEEQEQLGDFMESPASELAHFARPMAIAAASDDRSPVAGSYQETGILGDFRIEREIGRGGMGVVYEAEQISLGRRVALKTLPLAGMLDKTQLTRFKNESRAAASLNHPHVVSVYAVGSERGVHYYAMQLIDGYSVAELIEQRRCRFTPNATDEGPEARQPAQGVTPDDSASSGRSTGGDRPTEQYTGSSGVRSCPDRSNGDLPAVSDQKLIDTQRARQTQVARWTSDRKAWIRQMVELSIQAADALDHAHCMGIVHRDIKPSNLLVDAEGNLAIADFGLALVEADGNLTMTGHPIGTLRYMSPEQIRGDRRVLDHHTDIYSLGVTLYEMLTLQLPFPDRDPTRLMQRISQDEPTAPRRLNPDISRDLETIVLKAIAKEPKERYATAGELAKDLQRFLNDEPVRAKPPGVVDCVRKWARRHRSVVQTMAGTLAIAIGIAGVLLWHERHQTLAAFAGEKQQRRTAEQKEAEAQRQALRAGRAEAFAKKQADLADQQRQLAIAQKEEAVRNVYVAQMRLVMDEWNAGQVGRLDTMLGRYLPQAGEQDLREWEWYYAVSLAHSELMTLWVDGSGLSAVAWSSDGHYLASSSDSGLVKVWVADTGQEHMTLTGHSDEVNALAFSPDSRHLVSASADATIRIWDVGEGRATMTLDADATSAVLCADWSPDGTHFATGAADGVVRIRDTTNWQVVLELPSQEGNANALSWSADGSRIASGGDDGVVKIWDVANGKVIHTLRPPVEPTHQAPSAGRVESLAWSPDDRFLASSSTGACDCIWNVATGEMTTRLASVIAWSDTLAWSPDGKCLALAGSDEVQIQICEVGNGQQTHRLIGHVGHLRSVAWSPDGRRLASCSQDGTVKVWDPQLDAEAQSVPRGTVTQVMMAWSPDGQRLAVPGSDLGSLSIVDVVRRQEVVAIHSSHESICSVAWSPDGELLSSGYDDGTIGIWDVQQGVEVRTLRGHTGCVRTVAWSPNGQYLASGGDDTTARIWSFVAGKERYVLRGPDAVVDAVAWSPDGRRLASAPRSRGVRIWDANTGERQLTLAPRGRRDTFYGCVSWSPDGQQIATTGNSGWVEVWDAGTGRRLACLPGHRGARVTVAWHPDGKRLAVGGWIDCNVRIWDVSAQQELLSFSGRSPVAWSPNGRQLAHFSRDDGTIKIRDASNGYRFAETPNYRLELGRHFSALGEPAQAAAVYARLVADDPDVRAYQDLQQTEMARVFIDEEQLDAAVELLQTLESEDVKRHVREMIGDAYLRRAHTHLEENQFQEAIADFEKAIRLDPNDSETYNDYAWQLVTVSDPLVRNPARAITLATKAVELHSSDASYWNTLGFAQYRAGELAVAIESLNKSLELDSSSVALPYNALFLAMAYWQLGEQDDARQWYDKAVQWITDNNSTEEELLRFRAEAEALLAIESSKSTPEKSQPRTPESVEPGESSAPHEP